jgi:hypothetical protein
MIEVMKKIAIIEIEKKEELELVTQKRKNNYEKN